MTTTTAEYQHDPPASESLSRLLKDYITLGLKRYRGLHLYGKLFIWSLAFFYVALATAILVITPQHIAQFLYDQAHAISLHPLGWIGLAGALVLVSFPPLIGHSTLCTLCGFAYGMKGFAIASTGSLFGSALVFVVLRILFRRRLRTWANSSKKWQALESVVRAKRLPLIILIRVSPFPPWVYSNTLFASIESVAFWQFCVATLFVFPKICLHVFIGSRIAALSDGDQRSHMDSRTKALNGMLVGGGIMVAIFASWLVYTLVQRHIRHMDGVPPEVDEMAAEFIDTYDEEAPLINALSPRHSVEEH